MNKKDFYVDEDFENEQQFNLDEDLVDEDLIEEDLLVDELEDNNSIEEMELSDIFFKDFKENMQKEIIENEIDLDDLPEITLEQAVGDFRNGIQEAFDHIYGYYEPKLIRWGKRYNNEELGIELLHIVLLNAVNAFDNTAGAKFNTYFWACAHNYVNVHKKRNDAKKRQHYKNMISLQQKYVYKGGSSETDLEKTIEDTNDNQQKNINELKLAINSLEPFLKKNELTILLRIVDNDKLEEIGDELGVTAAAVCMALKRLGGKKKVASKLKEILYNYQ